MTNIKTTFTSEQVSVVENTMIHPHDFFGDNGDDWHQICDDLREAIEEGGTLNMADYIDHFLLPKYPDLGTKCCVYQMCNCLVGEGFEEANIFGDPNCAGDIWVWADHSLIKTLQDNLAGEIGLEQACLKLVKADANEVEGGRYIYRAESLVSYAEGLLESLVGELEEQLEVIFDAINDNEYTFGWLGSSEEAFEDWNHDDDIHENTNESHPKGCLACKVILRLDSVLSDISSSCSTHEMSFRDFPFEVRDQNDIRVESVEQMVFDCLMLHKQYFEAGGQS